MDEARVAAEEARLQELVRANDWVLAYKQSTIENPEYCEFSDHPWKIPDNSSITAKGRRLVSVDPNITSSTLSALLRSEASFFTKPEYKHFLNDSPTSIIMNEFAHGHMLGYAHVAQCISENFDQTKADLIARYSIDRRIPFVVGALLIDTLMQTEPLYYFKYHPGSGYKRVLWEPKKIYIKPQTVYPLQKRELKKYYTAPKTKPAEPQRCPACGSKTRILRVGYRGKKYHVCCTKRSCKWFLGSTPKNSEAEALAEWDRICTDGKEGKEGSERKNGGKS